MEAKKEPKKKQIKHAEVVAETVPTGSAPEAKIEVEHPEPAAAKAGKRSAKAAKEAGEKQAKEDRKATADASEAKKSKTSAKLPRTKAERAGKKYREAFKLIDRSKIYPLAEALELATQTSPVKFDASVEMHINLGVDPKQADQNVRDTVALPAGMGKEVRVAAISDDASAEKLIGKLDKEEIDFDILVATPAMMPRLGKYAKLLGPRGLMPSPKSGTVTQDVDEAVKQAKAGRVEYRVDQSGIVHLSIGKVSFGKDKLSQNAEAVLASIRAAKPASLKGIYIRSVFVSSTMGPSIKVEA
jgi:large subunit ribosomal protein L1